MVHDISHDIKSDFICIKYIEKSIYIFIIYYNVSHRSYLKLKIEESSRKRDGRLVMHFANRYFIILSFLRNPCLMRSKYPLRLDILSRDTVH